MFSLNSLNSVPKKLKIGTQDLLCKRQGLSHRATGNRADPYTEPNLCLSDFFRISEFPEFNESSAPFRENSNVFTLFQLTVHVHQIFCRGRNMLYSIFHEVSFSTLIWITYLVILVEIFSIFFYEDFCNIESSLLLQDPLFLLQLLICK